MEEKMNWIYFVSTGVIFPLTIHNLSLRGGYLMRGNLR